jgi:hypothetical protein
MHVCRFRVSVISVLIKVTENYFMQHDVPPLHCKQDPSEEQWGGSCLLGDADITVDTLYTSSANCWPQRSGTAVKGNDVIATVDRRKLMERELSHHRRYLRRFLMTGCLANTKDKVRGNRCSCIMPCKCPARKKGSWFLWRFFFSSSGAAAPASAKILRGVVCGCCVSRSWRLI